MAKCILTLLTIIFLSCGDKLTRSNNPGLQKASTNLKYKKGDCLAFKLDSSDYTVGIIIDISKDSGGLWYGLFFVDYDSKFEPEINSLQNKRAFGRKVESALNAKGYEIVLDGEFVNDSIISTQNDFTFIGNLSLNENAKFGSYGAATNISELVHSFRYGQARRLQPPDDFRDAVTKLEKFRPEEYFSLNDFLKK